MAWSPIESEQNESIIMNWNKKYASEKTAILAPVDLGGAVQHGVNLVTELVGGGAALGLGKVVKNVVNKVKNNRATDKSDLKARQDMWHMYGPLTQQMLIEHNDETANPFHPDHDLNRPYGRSVGNSYLPAFMPRGRSASSSFDKRYATEKTAFDFVTPALHVLQFGHGIVDVAKDMLNPVTQHFNGDPHKLHELQQNAQNFKAMEPGGGPGRWWADEHLQNYQDANRGTSFNGVGTAIDSAAALGGGAAALIKKYRNDK